MGAVPEVGGWADRRRAPSRFSGPAREILDTAPTGSTPTDTAPRARLEGKIAVDRLFTRFADIEITAKSDVE